MKRNLTVTLSADKDRPLPPDSAPFAGLRFEIKNAEGQSRQTPIEQKLIWMFAGLAVGEQYSLTVQSVDEKGAVIAALATIAFTVPAVGATYWHVTGAQLDWEAPQILPAPSPLPASPP